MNNRNKKRLRIICIAIISTVSIVLGIFASVYFYRAHTEPMNNDQYMFAVSAYTIITSFVWFETWMVLHIVNVETQERVDKL